TYWDLELSCTDHGAGEPLQGFIGFRAALFEPGFIAAMSDGFKNLVAGLVASPDEPVGNAPLLNEAQTRQVLSATFGYPFAVAEDVRLERLFAEQAQRSPDATALIFKNASLSYADLASRVTRLSGQLTATGLVPGKRVGLCLDPSEVQLASVLAILNCGCTVVPLDPEYPVPRLQSMADVARPALILYSGTSVAAELQGDFRKYDVCTLPEPDASITPLLPAEHSPAFMLFTSGSTGEPRGFEMTHPAAVSRCLSFWDDYDFSAKDVFLARTSMSFVDAIWEIFGALLHGIRVVVAGQEVRRDPLATARFVREHEVSHLALIPAFLEVFIDCCREHALQLPSLKSVICSGEAMRQDLPERFRAFFPGARLINTYGTTEFWDANSADVTHHLAADGVVPAGRPLANRQTCVLDAAGQLVPAGVQGELYVGGLGVPEHRPDKTASDIQSLCAGLFPTGDRARSDELGVISVLGRKDRQFKLRGYRIEPGAVEAVINAAPGVARSLVRHCAGTGGEQILTAYVQATSGQNCDHEVLRSNLRARLPAHLVPTAIVGVESFPRTPSGKIDVLALPVPQVAPSQARYTAPQTETECRLAPLWLEVLPCTQLSLHDDFFALHGHSLLAAKLMSRVCDVFDVDLPLQCLFAAPTVAGLAAHIDAVAWTLEGSAEVDGQQREVVRF
ncbi:MAG: AMP-binding protein, partial [Gammaproteobacteria bacterium]